MKELEPSMYLLCFPAHLSSSDALLLYYLSFIHAYCWFQKATALLLATSPSIGPQPAPCIGLLHRDNATE